MSASGQISPDKPRLTEEEKKKNHIFSEQRRREAIRAQYERLSEIIPGMVGKSRAEAVILEETVKFTKENIMDRKKLLKRCQQAGLPEAQWKKYIVKGVTDGWENVDLSD